MTIFSDAEKVDFVIAGTQKGGTTALDQYLRSHKDISMAKTKEVHFFDQEDNFNRPIDYSKYHSKFDASVQKKLRGEATPNLYVLVCSTSENLGLQSTDEVYNYFEKPD